MARVGEEREKILKVLSESDGETIQLGQRLGELLEAGDVVGLAGELGSGKTWFTKGIALGLGVDPHTVVTSPSFSLVNEYEGRHTFFHMDVYRLGTLTEFLSAGLEEYLYREGVVVIEWADRWPEILPDQHLRVDFVILGDDRREITLSGGDPKASKIIQGLRGSGMKNLKQAQKGHMNTG